MFIWSGCNNSRKHVKKLYSLRTVRYGGRGLTHGPLRNAFFYGVVALIALTWSFGDEDNVLYQKLRQANVFISTFLKLILIIKRISKEKQQPEKNML